MCCVNADEKDPKYETNDPGIRDIPKVEHELRRSEIAGNRDGIIEPIVPRKGKAIGWRKKACSVSIEGA